MPRPEQRGKTKRAEAHTGKHGGEIVDGQRCEGGAFAPGNSLAKGQGERISKGMQLRNALRDQVGEKRVRKLVDDLYEIATGTHQETKDRISAIKTLLEYSVGKPAQEVAVAAESDGQGNTRIMFVVKDGDDGEVQEL